MTDTPSLARRSLDMLMAMHAPWDVLVVDWQADGPWLLVTLGQPSSDDSGAFARHHFAIWRETGDVYGVQHDGSVTDDPLLALHVPHEGRHDDR